MQQDLDILSSGDKERRIYLYLSMPPPHSGDFMNFINKKYLCETYCEAVIVSHSDTLYFNNQDEMLLAAYDTNNNSIYVLDDVPEECFCYVLMSIALEYICYLQHIKNKKFCEQEASDFAMRTVDEYYKTKGVG